MYTETNSGEITETLAFWFFERKNPVRIEIYQKSLTEMLIL